MLQAGLRKAAAPQRCDHFPTGGAVLNRQVGQISVLLGFFASSLPQKIESVATRQARRVMIHVARYCTIESSEVIGLPG